MSRFISPITDLKPNGSLRFFESGTSTVLPTYKDSAETIANPTVVPVLPNGNVENVFYTGAAKVIFLDEFDQQYAERDPVSGVSSAGSGGLTEWDSDSTYAINEIVIGSNDQLYKSLTSGNMGNDPVTSPEAWEEIRFLGVWNTNITYVIGDVVQTSTGNLWKALTATSGNDPETDLGTNWLPAIDGEKDPAVIALSELNSWSTPETNNFTGVASESRQIDASTNTVDVALPTLTAGDSFVYHNQITSTFKVQILNPTETIKGKFKDFSAGTNVEISPGQSVQMIAKSATELSIVGVLL